MSHKSKITAFAKGRPCTVRSPVCNHNPETSVWAHINSVRWGSGKGIKSPDLCGCIACSACHDLIDGRLKTNLERDFIRMAAYEAHMESLYLLHKEGVI